jgi:hypothetical protein
MKLKQTVENCRKCQIREDKNVQIECHFNCIDRFPPVFVDDL